MGVSFPPIGVDEVDRKYRTDIWVADNRQTRDFDTMGAAITFTYHLVEAPEFKGPVFLGIGRGTNTPLPHPPVLVMARKDS